MSDAAVNGSGAPLTMEPDDQIAPVEESIDPGDIIGESMDGEDEHEIDGDADAAEEIVGSALRGDITVDDIKAGLDTLSGGIATAQDIENAARADEGLPPKEQVLPLDFGPFNPDAALKAIFEKQAEIKELQADYDTKKDEAKEAKSELDKASRALVAIIDALKNRRQQALNPSQPYLKDVAESAPSLNGCPWERDHPGQACPICTEAKKVNMIPAVESEVHPENEKHATVAEAARVKNVLEPLAEKLRDVNVFVWPSALAGLSTEELSAIQSYADEPTPMPPHLVTRCCIAAEPGSLIQVCQRCEDILVEVVDETNVYPVGAFVGFACAAYVPRIDETHEQTSPSLGDGLRAAAKSIREGASEEAPRKPRSHAKKNLKRSTEPEQERAKQVASARATEKPSRRRIDPAKGKKAKKRARK